MFRNMACSLIRSMRIDEDDPQAPAVPGRIVTTVAKAKELRPYIEKLITLARKARVHEEQAEQYGTTAERDSDAWRSWRDSDQWNQWAQAMAPAVALRRRVFQLLRDNEAVDILFDEIAERFADRPGGYTRVVRLAKRRLGDAGEQALIEFVGERDRTRSRQRSAPVVVADEPAEETSESAETPAEAPESESPAEEQAESTEGTESAEASEAGESGSEDEDKK